MKAWLEDKRDWLLDIQDGWRWRRDLAMARVLLWVMRGLVGLMGPSGPVLYGDRLYEMEQEIAQWKRDFEEWKAS